MLGRIRKFSNTIFAKIFLFIVAIPFVFWGMGDLFSTGNKNTIAKIDNEKFSTQEFVYFVNNRNIQNQTLDDSLVDNLLSSFIGEKLMDKEINNFNIKLSDSSLSEIIKNQKIFKKENEFSRTAYEKFLVEKSIDAVTFENNLSIQEKQKQLFSFIGGGVVSPNFLINLAYNKINQKRNVELIDLNDVFIEELKFTNNEIESYYDHNKENYKDTFKKIKFIRLNSMNLTGNDEYSDLFFKKIDEIDDLIVSGKTIEYILQKYNLKLPKIISVNESGNNKNSKKIKDFSENLIKNSFSIKKNEPTILLEDKGEYFILELLDTEIIEKGIDDQIVKNKIITNLKKDKKRKLISDLMSKINNNSFNKNDFDKLSSQKNLIIKNIKFENQNDDKILKKELVSQIYSYPEKKVIVIVDIGLSENFLVYINKIDNVSINKNAENYDKYLNLSNVKITNDMYNTYDYWLKKKYKIDINYQALEEVKNLIK